QGRREHLRHPQDGSEPHRPVRPHGRVPLRPRGAGRLLREPGHQAGPGAPRGARSALSVVAHRHTHSSRHKARLWAVLGLSASFMLVQVIVGWWTNPLALLADAAHLFVDTAGVGLSLLAVWFAERPATPEKTYGYYRVEILAALVNGVVLCVLAIVILVEAWRRLSIHPEVTAGPRLLVAGARPPGELPPCPPPPGGSGHSPNLPPAP